MEDQVQRQNLKLAIILMSQCLALVTSSSNNDSLNCFTWSYYDKSTNRCRCFAALSCVGDRVLIPSGECASIVAGKYYVGKCPFGHPVNRTNRVYSEMPSDPALLNDFMCAPHNRRGLLCGECTEGHGVSAYSFNMNCVKCSSSTTGMAIVLFLSTFLLTTLLFIVFVIFQVNITTGPLLGYVLFCQIYVITFKQIAFIYNYILSESLTYIKILFDISLALCQFWNLQFFQTAIPPFCISDKLNNLDIIMLSLIPAIYPVVLVIITCILMELHGNNYRIIILCRPFNFVLKKINVSLATSDAVFRAFASFIFLSNKTVMFGCILLQIHSNLLLQNGQILKHALYYQGNEDHSSTRYILYTVISLVPFTVITVIPSIILIIYPTRLYERISQCLSIRKRLAITAFAEALNGHLKDGLNETTDYRFLAGFEFPGIIIFIFFITFFEEIDVGKHLAYLFFFTLSGFIISQIKPCKSTIAKMSMSFHFLLGYVGCFARFSWRNYLSFNTRSLELLIVFVPLTSHSLVFLWAVYKMCSFIKRRHRLKR